MKRPVFLAVLWAQFCLAGFGYATPADRVSSANRQYSFETAGIAATLSISTDSLSQNPFYLSFSRTFDDQTIQLDGLTIGTVKLRRGGLEGTMVPVWVQGLTDGGLLVRSEPPQMFGLDGLHLLQTFRFTESGLFLENEWFATDTVEVLADISVDLTVDGADRIRTLNAFGSSALVEDGSGDGYMQQHAVSQDVDDVQLTVTFGNPFAGDVIRTGEGVELRVFRTTNKNSVFDGPVVHSVLVPDQVIRRPLGVYLEVQDDFFLPHEGLFALPNPHKNGVRASAVFLGDDIPLTIPQWLPLTDETNQHPVLAGLASLMINNPDLRMTFVVVFDHLAYFWTSNATMTDGWSMDPGNIAYVDDGVEGERCLRMEVAADTLLTLSQTLGMSDESTINISAQLKSPDQLQGGFRFQLETRDGVALATSEPIQPNPEWQEYSWSTTLYEVYEPLTLRLILDHGGGAVYVDDVRVSHSSPVHNGGFETGRTWVHFDTDQPHTWLHTHGHARITELPQEYIDHLNFLASDETEYGYEDRIHLGLHAYHHSMMGDYIFSSNRWSEFAHPDPAFHREALEVMFADAMTLGLDSSDFQVLRTGQFVYQHYTVQEALRHNLVWMDADDGGFGCGLFPLYGNGRSIWMHRKSFWGDDLDNYYSDLSRTKKTLAMGGTAHWGWHPGAGLDEGDPAMIASYNGIFEELHTEFPGFEWEFADELGNRGNALESWRVLVDTLQEDQYTYRFDAAVDSGMSLSLHFADSIVVGHRAQLDGNQMLPLTFFDQYATLELPKLEAGEHRVVFYYTRLDEQPPIPRKMALPISPFFRVWPVPTNAEARVIWTSPEIQGMVNVSLYDILGRKVMSEIWYSRAGSVAKTLHLEQLPSGTYFVMLHNPASGLRKQSRIILLK